MRVLVTGGAGFVGSHVVDALAQRGAEVRVLDALHPAAHSGEPGYLNPRADYVWGDVRDEALVERLLQGVDAVSHQAAMVGLGVDPADVAEYASVNDLGTAVLLRALWRSGFRGRLVLASSMVVYGEGRYRCSTHGVIRPRPREEADLARGRFDPLCPTCAEALAPEEVTENASLDPRNVYAATKVHQEHLGAAVAREAGFPFAALRYHNVYGPRMPSNTPYAGVASLFRSALAEGKSPRVFEDGGQRRDFVHVQDVARANVLAVTLEPPPGGAFNVASGSPRTVGEMARALASAFGPGHPRPIVTGEYRLGDVRHVFASIERIRERMGFVPAMGFEEGMRAFAGEQARAPVGCEVAHNRNSG
ncbi:MAG TPA: NAD-dependent epimerase/dehydratase family protein [Actinomycetota bacterium]|nr:NAD-dependent epimerase/dehydratase family protein [Actinomycetota bacterium]